MTNPTEFYLGALNLSGYVRSFEVATHDGVECVWRCEIELPNALREGVLRYARQFPDLPLPLYLGDIRFVATFGYSHRPNMATFYGSELSGRIHDYYRTLELIFL